jgi:hypothetical protein
MKPDMEPSPITLAALEKAVRAGPLDDVLAEVSSVEVRAQLRRALEIDRQLWTEHPDSLASCIMARLHGVPELEPTLKAWEAESEARGLPWVRSLRPLPSTDGLLATLHSTARTPLEGLQRVDFESEDVVRLTALRFHPSVQPPEERRRDRLRWSWRTGDAVLAPDPEADDDDVEAAYPRFVSDGWGPCDLVREPGGERTPLPCPPEGSASGRASDDGSVLFVYGSQEDGFGGFVYVLDRATLEIVRELLTARPVSGVHESARRDLLLVETYGDLVAWRGETAAPLPIAGRDLALSPSGRHVATLGDDGLRVWEVDALHGPPPALRHPPLFDPTGDRLLAGSELRDGRTGTFIAKLELDHGGFLAGGPAQPSLHVGSAYVIELRGALSAWDTRTGARRADGPGLFWPQWFSLAHDRAGRRVAALHRARGEVVVHDLPSGDLRATLDFGASAREIAMSADGEVLGVRDGEASWRFKRLDGRDVEPDEGLAATAGGPALAPAPAPPSEWEIEPGTATRFTHRPSGTCIAFPCAGPWSHNPADARLMAAADAHIELRGPEGAAEHARNRG